MTVRLRCALILTASAFALSTSGTPALAGSVESSRATTLDRDPEIASLRAGVAAAPGDPCPLNEMGVALARRTYYDEAVDAFRASLDLRPDPIVWNNLGSVHLTRGKLGPAESAFNDALKLDPNFALAHYNLGAVYDAQRNENGAVEHYKRALELNPQLDNPAVNPAILNNHYLLTVRTQLYLETVGALGMPMQAMCTPAPAALPPPAATAGAEEVKGKGWWIFHRRAEKAPAPNAPAPEPVAPAVPAAPPAPPDPAPAPEPPPVPGS